jgi:hypothetical protein
MKKVLIFTPIINSRVQYTFEILLQSILGLEFELTTNIELFLHSEMVKFSYASKPLSSELFFEAHFLLFQEEINNDFFQNKIVAQAFEINNNSNLPIDIFAASFYLLTRYEEYGTENFDYTNSILHRSKLLQSPIINEWVIELKNILHQKFPLLQFKKSKYQITATIDVDRAYAFKARNLMTTMGAFAKDFLKGNWSELMYRWNVLQNKKNDPFNVFLYLDNLHLPLNMKSIYFFHCGNYAGVDKNMNLHHPLFFEVINQVAKQNFIGIHPSVLSNKKSELIKSEIATLQNILPNHTIENSRQHFIKLSFPNTYQQLINHHIQHDFTMGYANEAGFRAGISSTYAWYNLQTETKTNLYIHPFCLMEATFQYYKKNDKIAFLKTAKQIAEAVKNVQADLNFAWHNQSFSELYEYKGWSKVYPEFLAAII